MFGTGFLLNKELRRMVVEFKAVSDRICWIRLRGKYRKITIINCHAPAEDKDMEVKNDFYEQIREIMDQLPKYDIKIILGDFNAKIGREDE